MLTQVVLEKRPLNGCRSVVLVEVLIRMDSLEIFGRYVGAIFPYPDSVDRFVN